MATIDALQREQSALQNDLRRLQAQHGRLTDEHLALLAELGRGRSVDESALDAKAGALTLLEAEIEQKRAGLAQVGRELQQIERQAEADAAQSERNRLDALRAEYCELAADLDANPLQVDTWRRLREIAIEGNRAARRLNDGYAMPFKPVDADLKFWFKRWGEDIYSTVTSSRRNLAIKLPSESLQLDQLNDAIDYLLG